MLWPWLCWLLSPGVHRVIGGKFVRDILNLLSLLRKFWHQCAFLAVTFLWLVLDRSLLIFSLNLKNSQLCMLAHYIVDVTLPFLSLQWINWIGLPRAHIASHLKNDRSLTTSSTVQYSFNRVHDTQVKAPPTSSKEVSDSHLHERCWWR